MAQPLSTPKQSIPLIRLEPNPRIPGLCSIFTDAAWNSSTGTTGLGWIIDDLVSLTQHSATVTSVSSSLMTETLAVRSAMTFALSIRLDSIALFSDSQTLINVIKKKSMNLEIFRVINDIYLLASSFTSVVFNFILRSANVKEDLVVKHVIWASNPV